MDYSDNRNDELSRNEILSRIRPGNTILNLGAGAGIIRQIHFRGLAGRVCSDIRHVATDAGFEAESIRLQAGQPEYLRMWASTYLFSTKDWSTPVPPFSTFHILLIACLRKRCA